MVTFMYINIPYIRVSVPISNVTNVSNISIPIDSKLKSTKLLVSSTNGVFTNKLTSREKMIHVFVIYIYLPKYF